MYVLLEIEADEVDFEGFAAEAAHQCAVAFHRTVSGHVHKQRFKTLAPGFRFNSKGNPIENEDT